MVVSAGVAVAVLLHWLAVLLLHCVVAVLVLLFATVVFVIAVVLWSYLLLARPLEAVVVLSRPVVSVDVHVLFLTLDLLHRVSSVSHAFLFPVGCHSNLFLCTFEVDHRCSVRSIQFATF